MDNEIKESLSAITELKTSSRSSMTMVLVGFAMLVTSFVYSFSRLAPLEKQVQAKQAELTDAAESLRDIQAQIRASEDQLKGINEQNDNLVRTIEQLQARLAALQSQPTVSPEARKDISDQLKATENTAKEVGRAGKNVESAVKKSHEDVARIIRRLF